ncbi:hypothetical protein FKP32DRAFT_1530914, partial [Trametes sanguinea]
SQGCLKGNIAVHPQDSPHLNEVLPPGNDVLRDTVCAVFVGATKPTRENIQKLKPVLVRKYRVKSMITFLTENNPLYHVSGEFQGFSQQNMDDLFGPGTAHVEEGVPCAMDIGHILPNNAEEGATAGYVPEHDLPSRAPADGDELLMETVGYTDGDDSPVNYHEMTMRALSHCLTSG